MEIRNCKLKKKEIFFLFLNKNRCMCIMPRSKMFSVNKSIYNKKVKSNKKEK